MHTAVRRLAVRLAFLLLPFALLVACGEEEVQFEPRDPDPWVTAAVDSLAALHDVDALDDLADSVERARQPYNVVAVSRQLYEEYAMQERFDYMLAEALRAHFAAEMMNDTIELIRAFYHRGAAGQRIGFYNTAIESLYRAQELYNSYSRKSSYEARLTYANVLSSLGNLLMMTKDYESAAERFRQAMKLDQQLESWSGKAQNMTDLAFAYLSMGDTEKAENYLRQSYVEYKKQQSKHGMALSERRFGIIQASQQRYTEAIKTLEQAHTMLTANGYEYDALEVDTMLLRIYFDLGLKEKAKPLFTASMHQAERLRHMVVVARFYEMLVVNNPENHSRETLIRYRDRAHELRDSLDQERQNLAVHATRMAYERQMNYNEMVNQTREHATQSQLRATRWTLILTATVAILIVILSISRIVTHHRLRLERDKAEQAQQAAEEARRHAEKANDMKSAFLHSMTHELRTPLNAIQGFAYMISNREAMGFNEADIAGFSREIRINSENLANLVHDLMVISEMETDALTVHLEPVRVYDLCLDIFDEKLERVPERVELQVDDNADHELVIESDGILLSYVLSNLVSNACKYTTIGSITVGYDVQTADETPSNQPFHSLFTLTVTDTGCGIAPENAHKIFDRFEKLGSTIQGNGLGLSICRMVATKLRGTIHLDTNYTSGARFIFQIPLTTH